MKSLDRLKFSLYRFFFVIYSPLSNLPHHQDSRISSVTLVLSLINHSCYAIAKVYLELENNNAKVDGKCILLHVLNADSTVKT